MPLSPVAVAERFAPMALDAVRERSDLQDRRESKYVVPLAMFAALAEHLVGTHAVLEIDGARGFAYRTTYLDTPDLMTYREHRQGRRQRFKCRAREYSDSGQLVFEVKLKGLRGRTVKRRLEDVPDAFDPLAGAPADFLASCLLESYGRALTSPLRPVLVVTYTRVTLASPDLAERLTCDSFVQFAAPAGATAAMTAGVVILESKSAHGDARADRALRTLGARPVADCSKYCLGVTLTHPGMPANALRPLLRRYFASPEADEQGEP